MDQSQLFDLPEEGPAGKPPRQEGGRPRLRMAQREQVVMRTLSLDQMLPCGDVTMNYHTLADFRLQHAEILDDLLTEQVAALMHAGAVTIECVAQEARQRGLQQFRVRGLSRVRAVAVLFVLAHNLGRWKALRAEGSLKIGKA